MRSENNTTTSEFVVGRNPVEEALRAGTPLNKVMVVRGEHSGNLARLVSLAKGKGIPVKEVDVKKLEALSGGASHQGIMASLAAHKYASVEEILALASDKGEDPFVIILDGIEDPHNLGAIIRSAEACGAHGVIIPERRGALLTGVVSKTSAGAVEHLPVARVTNIARTMDQLKDAGLWLYGLDMDGEDYRKVDYSGGVGIVVGNEGKGISRLVREKCDFVVSIPMRGQVNSLNASVAAGIVMYAAKRD